MFKSLERLIQYGFDKKYIWMLIIICSVLIVFHMFAFISPFITVLENKADYLLKISSTISGITSTFFLVLLIVLGYKSVYDYNEKRRMDIYNSIEKQIIEWFKKIDNLNYNDFIISNDKLRHFQVKAKYQSLCSDNRNIEEKKIFCNKVHYELTHYPTELVYGIHFEFDKKTENSIIFDKFKDMIDFIDTCSFLSMDKEIPKKPGWIFLVRKVELSGDFDKDIPIIATHARHFVELVCHTFPVLYCSDILNAYINCINK